MEVIDWSAATPDERRKALTRPKGRDDPGLLELVRTTILDVRRRGWAAVEHHARWIDGSAPKRLAVAPAAREALNTVPKEFVDALNFAARNIELFHAATKPRDVTVETLPGVSVSKAWRPIERVGLYVPGGSAPLFSTLLMLAIPARSAGVKSLTVVTPPRDRGLDPAIALAADLCGIDEIWTIGGAHAIGALAFGAGEIEAVDLICGPGNAWVSAAKSFVASFPGGPGIDLPAGPSELMVIADGAANPARVAADLLSQAEHDVQAQVLLVETSANLIADVGREWSRQVASLSRAVAPVRAILCDSLDEAIEIANGYAPEHLSLAVERPDALVPHIVNAGAIFVGASSGECFADYCAGSSHVLPTDRAARFAGGVSTATFMKAVTVQKVTADAAASLAAPTALLARAEGLEAHARAAEARA